MKSASERLGSNLSEQRWSLPLRSAWGKYDRDTGDWMPLLQHLIDTALIAGWLWDEWLSPHVRWVIERHMPEGARDGRALFMLLAGLHDIGKLSPAFAMQQPDAMQRMAHAGLTVPGVIGDRHLAPHGLCGQVVIREWLVGHFGVTARTAVQLADVVGAHHGRPTSPSQVRHVAQRATEFLGGPQWAEVREEAAQTIADLTQTLDLLPQWRDLDLGAPALVLLSGAVIVADWLASNVGFFGYRREITTDPRRAAHAWSQIGLLSPWQPSDQPPTLAERFPHLAGLDPRPIQRACIDAARDAKGPTMMILEAPMGGGKTEAALLAAEALARSSKASGVIMGLPTMATSDAMFDRVKTWLDGLPGGGKSTYLAHSKADLNETFSALKHHSRLMPVYDDTTNESGHVDGGDAVATAVSWLAGRKKGVLANFVVGTIDQVLAMGLAAKHVALRHLAIAGKVIILDEVHAADEHMRVFLKLALEWLGGYGCSVLLLSATLPGSHRNELIAAYQRGLSIKEKSVLTSGSYPLLTVVSSQGVTERGIPAEGDGREVRLQPLTDGDEDLLSTLESALRGGGCAAVIRNTVARAQATAQLLQAYFGPDVVLNHSRFIAVERAERDQHLRSLLGPEGKRPKRLIVVGTQVLEQSLDIDFDVMISDIAPADLLLQRVGRLQRHPRQDRPGGLETPTLYVTGIEAWGSEGPEFAKAITHIYSPSPLLRTVAAFEIGPHESNSIRLPDQIRTLVEATYSQESNLPEAWRARADKAGVQWLNDRNLAIGRAAPKTINHVPEAGQSSIFWQYLTSLELDGESLVGGAGVRDGEDGVEVALIQRIDGTLRLLPGSWAHAGEALSSDLEPPGPELAIAVVRSCVRLPIAMTTGRNGDEVVAALEAMGCDTWQTSPWLRGLLTLSLDENLTADVGRFTVTYDSTLGLLHHERSTR